MIIIIRVYQGITQGFPEAFLDAFPKELPNVFPKEFLEAFVIPQSTPRRILQSFSGGDLQSILRRIPRGNQWWTQEVTYSNIYSEKLQHNINNRKYAIFDKKTLFLYDIINRYCPPYSLHGRRSNLANRK